MQKKRHLDEMPLILILNPIDLMKQLAINQELQETTKIKLLANTWTQLYWLTR